ncbi:hypothetical protein ILYODFUR_038741 [Ilyodon furcidens]|uniref:Uncharacterized protein n=1 Tax=Ilyodon furcidens TaxID=33524 RepID=A0ABV0TRL9_9TELE
MQFWQEQAPLSRTSYKTCPPHLHITLHPKHTNESHRPIVLQRNPSSVSFRSISVVVCLPTGSNLLQCYVQCVLMKQKKEQHAVSHTHLPKRYKSLLAVKCMPVLCTLSRGREEQKEERKNLREGVDEHSCGKKRK